MSNVAAAIAQENWPGFSTNLGRSEVSQQFEQLPMFATADQIMQRWRPGDRRKDENIDELYEGKAVEADSYLGDALESAGGVENPIEVGPRHLLNGHHRVAWVKQHHPDWLIPLQHWTYRANH